ncbi:hypothetical protein ABTZ46_14500 [Nocardioides sp. NPDC126508]
MEARPIGVTRFRSSLAHTISTIGDIGLREWVRSTEDLLTNLLPGYLLIDLQRLGVSGATGGRRLAHHRGPGGEALVTEQWFVPFGGQGHTLTATVETNRYPALADVIRECARQWHPTETSADVR